MSERRIVVPWDDMRVQQHKPNLNGNLCLPSYVHGYSLGVGFMRDWFLSQFPKDYFKTVHIGGKNAFDDLRRYDIGDYAKRLKPAVSIFPKINNDFTREGVDTYLAGKDRLLRTTRINESFFKDYENNIFMGVRLHQIEIDLTYRVRLYTKAQQIDVYNNMVLGLRTGATQSHYLTVDYQIPYNLILTIARDAGFKLKEVINENTGKPNGDKEVDDPIMFCAYLNRCSGVPFIYKFRNINGKKEYFVRVNGVLAHISCLDRPDADDGERIGQVDDNFTIEQNVILKLPVPYFYTYFSEDDAGLEVNYQSEGDLGLYSIQYTELPDYNDKKWNQIMNTDYYIDDEDLKKYSLSLKEVLEDTFERPECIRKVLDYCNSIGLSNSRFIEIRAWQSQEIPLVVNYNTFDVTLPNTIKNGDKLRFAIYADLDFINEINLNVK